MRLIKQDIDREVGSGSATLLPEEPEDIVSIFHHLDDHNHHHHHTRNSNPNPQPDA